MRTRAGRAQRREAGDERRGAGRGEDGRAVGHLPEAAGGGEQRVFGAAVGQGGPGLGGRAGSG